MHEATGLTFGPTICLLRPCDRALAMAANQLQSRRQQSHLPGILVKRIDRPDVVELQQHGFRGCKPAAIVSFRYGRMQGAATPVNAESRTAFSDEWERVGARESPSWYLDPLVAAQKRRVHQELVWRWTRGVTIRRALKTDSFEEAHGDDCILFDLFPSAHTLGIDIALSTARRAHPDARTNASDSWSATSATSPFAGKALDAIISTSTLDHSTRAPIFEAGDRPTGGLPCGPAECS